MSACCGPIVGCAPSLSAKAKYSVAKWYYLIGFIITVILTWVLRDYASDWFAANAGAFTLCQQSEFAGVCGGQEVAIRVSFGNFCFFALHMICLACLNNEDDPRVALHGSMWLWQTLLWIGTLVGFFFVPSSALFGFAQVARVGSGFFLVLQLILLIHFVYEVSEWLVAKDNGWAWTLLVSGSVICAGLGLTLIGFSFYYFAPNPGCGLNIFFATWSIIVLLMLVGVLFVPNRAPTAGLLTSGAVFLYCSFLLYSALNSEPSGSACIRASVGSSNWVQIVAFFVALASICYSTYSAGISSKDLFGMRGGGSPSDAEDSGELPYRADFFHLIFALASMYIAMLFSDWQVSPSTSNFELDRGWVSVWIKMASKWVCEALYLWSVIAPAVMPNRDFGYSA